MGIAIGFILSSFGQIGGLTASIIQYTTLIGTVILVLRFIIEYLQENSMQESKRKMRFGLFLKERVGVLKRPNDTTLVLVVFIS
jgi:hypothetical protein